MANWLFNLHYHLQETYFGLKALHVYRSQQLSGAAGALARSIFVNVSADRRVLRRFDETSVPLLLSVPFGGRDDGDESQSEGDDDDGDSDSDGGGGGGDEAAADLTTPPQRRVDVSSAGDMRLVMGVRVLTEKRRRLKRDPADLFPVSINLTQTRDGNTAFFDQRVTIMYVYIRTNRASICLLQTENSFRSHSSMLNTLEIEHGLLTGFYSQPSWLKIIVSVVVGCSKTTSNKVGRAAELLAERRRRVSH